MLDCPILPNLHVSQSAKASEHKKKDAKQMSTPNHLSLIVKFQRLPQNMLVSRLAIFINFATKNTALTALCWALFSFGKVIQLSHLGGEKQTTDQNMRYL